MKMSSIPANTVLQTQTRDKEEISHKINQFNEYNNEDLNKNNLNIQHEMDTKYLRGNIKRLHKIVECNYSLILLASILDAQSDSVTLFSNHKISLPFFHEMACTYRD